MFCALSFIVPAPTFAATAKKPTCTLLITSGGIETEIDERGSVYIQDGNELTIAWEGEDAQSASMNGEAIDTEGTATVTPEKKTTYTYTFKNGSKTAACSVTAYPTDVEVTSPSATNSTRPAITGTAEGVKTVYVTVQKVGTSKIAYRSSALKVSKEKWKTQVSKKLAKGKYLVTVRGMKSFDISTLATSTLTIGERADAPVAIVGTQDTTLVVSSIPLLAGGIARAGTAVPIQYLQVTNVGKKSMTVTGFTLTQKGSANSAIVSSLSTVDDVGGSRGQATSTAKTPLFKENKAFVPTNATFAPGQMRLFTIKAHLPTNVLAQTGKTLRLELIAVSTTAKNIKGVFPIRGTTWTLSQ